MQRAVNQMLFGITPGIEYLLMAVLGGAGHVGGAILGAGIVTLLEDQLQRICRYLFGSKGNYEMIVFGALLVILLQTAREGLWPRLAALIPESGQPPRPPGGRAATHTPDAAARRAAVVAEGGAQGIGRPSWSTMSTSTCRAERSSA